MNILKTILAVMTLAVFTTHASARAEFESAEVEAWADEVLGTAFEEKRFSGAVISVVQDGEIVLAKGYGYADYASKTPVDPAQTKFLIASVAKTFTATAIAQLLERGLIDSLDDPANKYMKRFQLPQSGDRAITLWHLLTHSAGFEDRFSNMATEEDLPLEISGEYIKSVMPALVRETGKWVVYDNFGMSLLGVVIEDITGQPYAEFIEQNIFTPLGMDSSVISPNTQPVPGAGQAYATYPNGTLEPLPLAGINPFYTPVGAFFSTATDMARYMTAHLEEGRGNENSILNTDSFELMHTIHKMRDPLPGGWGMVFPIRYWGSEKLVAHEGGWIGASVKMTLMMNSGAGVFITVMGGNGSDPLDDTPNPDFERKPQIDIDGMTSEFIERFIGPYRPPESVFAKTPVDEDLSRYVGTYVNNRRSFSTYEMIDILFSTLSVELNDEGGLEFLGVEAKAIAPGIFWPEGLAPKIVGFTEDDEGMHLMVDGVPTHFTRYSGFSNPAFILAPMPFCLFLIFTGFIAAFWPAKSRVARNGRWLAVAAPLCLIGMVAFMKLGFAHNDSLELYIATGRIDRFIGLISIANLLALLSVLMIYVSVMAWRCQYWGLGKRAMFRRIHFTLVTIAVVLLLPVLSYTHLLGLHLP